MVYYRKYRPQTIDDLDNTSVREKLSSVLKNSATHAFLFTGPKGLGKTSAARIIAKVVNCEKKKKGDIEPCGKCEQCVSITNGTNLDVLEIDAASNRGIDEIRDLKEKIRLAPASAKVKVYIIDEVHMLTTEAFNALLKTLEEPPAHAMFILCTTEPHKVPATIMSRCMHINFTPATEEELVRSFKRIVKAEKIDIDDEALKYIAGLSDRGFRDGAKILEEVVALSDGKKITKELLENKFQISNFKFKISNMLEVLVKKDTKTGLEIVAKLVDEGIEIKYFLQVLMEELHGLMLSKIGVSNSSFATPVAKAMDVKKASEDKQELGINDIKILFELLSKAYVDMKYAVVPQLPLELAIIEYCEERDKQEARSKKQEGEQVKNESNSITVSSLRKQVGTMKKAQVLYGLPKKDDVPEEPTIKTSTVELMQAAPNGDVTQEWLDHFWRQLIMEMKKYNHTIAGVLRGCSIKSYDKKTLVIQANYKFHKERLDNVKTQEALADVCKLLTGKDVKVVVELKT